MNLNVLRYSALFTLTFLLTTLPPNLSWSQEADTAAAPAAEASTAAADPAAGEQLFQQYCTQCHKLGSVLIGPDLLGVTERRDAEWLLDFIHNSQAMVEAGDETAVQLFEEYNRTIMPPQPVTDQEVRNILAYIQAEEVAMAEQETVAVEGTAGGAAGAGGASITGDNTFTFLIAGILILLVMIMALSFNILKLVMRLQEVPGEEPKPAVDWQYWAPRLMVAFGILLLLGIVYESFIHVDDTLPEASSAHGRELDMLFNITLLVTLVVFVVTQLLLFAFSWKYRKRADKPEQKATYYPENNKLELFWTAVPAVVLFVLIFFGFRTWQDITNPSEKTDVQVEVFGYQFGWHVRYPGPDGEFGRADFRLISPTNPMGLDFDDEYAQDDIVTTELNLPVDQEVVVKVRSRDVLHAPYLPHFRIQIYAVPGMPTQFKFTPIVTTTDMRAKLENPDFVYELACNQICGAAHFNMRMVVEIQEEEVYTQWLAEQQPFYERFVATSQTAQAE